ncbi:MAG TPA: MarR family transcriptional regulator [Armatimonadota bacterium]|nr:MarR family transcriptional regulator [Armatimonadota bacterium]
MNETTLSRESIEYLEILSSVFAEIVRKEAASCESNSDSSITPSLVQCLQYIYLHGPSPVRKIATGLAITVPAASQLVERLVRKGLVNREHNKQDRRFASVSLTEEGIAVVQHARSARTAWLREVLNKMPEDKRRELVDTLEEFIKLILESSGNVDEACMRCGIDHLAFCIVNKVSVETTGKPMIEF